jgi:hypothetical protein
MTAVEEAVATEEDATAVVETRPETETAPEASPPVEFIPVEPAPEVFEFTAEIDAPDRVFPPSLVDLFGGLDNLQEWLRKPIVVPKVKVVIPPGSERWFFSQLRQREGLAQPLFWLTQAKVDQSTIDRVMLLPDHEFNRFFTTWQEDSFGAGPGE